MADTVLVSIPVTAEAAEMLRDNEQRAIRAGRMLSNLLKPATFEPDALTSLMSAIRADARAAGLTDEDVDAELAAHKAERRH